VVFHIVGSVLTLTSATCRVQAQRDFTQRVPMTDSTARSNWSWPVWPKASRRETKIVDKPLTTDEVIRETD